MAPLDAQVALTDKYRISSGAALMTGMQALVRLVLEQADMDRDAGLKTGGYVSGYRGSPIGAFDMELARAKEELKTRGIVFNPGLNEDLAATAVGGTQMLAHFDDPEVEGVFAVWYGKGPGVDRSIDAITHANLAGSSPKGGQIFLMGDDPLSKSSTNAHQSEQAMISALVPILYPSSVHDYVPLGLHAFAMSRFSGAAVGVKIVTDTADSTATVALDRLRPKITLPEPPVGALPLHNTKGYLPYLLQEQRQMDRLEAVRRYARANRLNRPVFEPEAKKLGIVAVGKAAADARMALRMMGLTEAEAAARGIGLFHMSMVWPVEPESLLEFVQGYDEVVVLEEKRPIVEPELARLLVNLRERPVLLGKQDADGRALTPDVADLSPGTIAKVLERCGKSIGLTALEAPRPPELRGNAPQGMRTAFYCAGCPHNRSTRVPEGSMAGGGIGCHAMSVMFDQDTTQYFTQMGGEGMSWVGRAHFSSRKHMFQNLGDGTYVHSGLLAIRAAIASGVNITYKILYNDAVAMTGGQRLEGAPLPAQIAAEVLAIGAKRVAVVSDDVEATRGTGEWPSAKVTFHHRSEHIPVQEGLREEEGTTVLIYVQTCAAEKRRRRKRGLFPDPPKRVVINPEVCEGCGDCGLKSNCVAVKPLDTPFGTKRQIDQTNCNKDYSCLEGFCPSFVTVEADTDPLAAKAGIQHQPPEDGLPEPALTSAEDFGAVITGIGGTGVVTVGAVLAMAARLEGLHALALDQTGLSQKNGAVSSHLQIGTRPLDDRPSKLPPGAARTLIACDLFGAAGDDILSLVRPEGVAVGNGLVEPLPMFARNPDARPDAEQLIGRLNAWFGEDRVNVADASGLARALVGDGMGSNLMLVGVACQAGALPVSAEAIERAIRLNNAAVDMNIAAFRWGRWIVHDPAMVDRTADVNQTPSWKAESYDELVARFETRMADWGGRKAAARFRAALAPMEAAEERVAPGRRELSRVAARALVKAMAYKDEFEVARLHASSDFARKIEREFIPGVKLKFHLAPPGLTRTDPVTGEPRKMAFGQWMLTAFGLLQHGRRIRGTVLDPFGRTEERREEKALAAEVVDLVALAAERLGPETEAPAREMLEATLEVKGFGHVKKRNLDAQRPKWRAAAEALRAGPAKAAA